MQDLSSICGFKKTESNQIARQDRERGFVLLTGRSDEILNSGESSCREGSPDSAIRASSELLDITQQEHLNAVSLADRLSQFLHPDVHPFMPALDLDYDPIVREQEIWEILSGDTIDGDGDGKRLILPSDTLDIEGDCDHNFEQGPETDVMPPDEFRATT